MCVAYLLSLVFKRVGNGLYLSPLFKLEEFFPAFSFPVHYSCGAVVQVSSNAQTLLLPPSFILFLPIFDMW